MPLDKAIAALLAMVGAPFHKTFELVVINDDFAISDAAVDKIIVEWFFGRRHQEAYADGALWGHVEATSASSQLQSAEFVVFDTVDIDAISASQPSCMKEMIGVVVVETF